MKPIVKHWALFGLGLVVTFFAAPEVASADGASPASNAASNTSISATGNEHAADVERRAPPRDGLRFRAGAFGIAHARDMAGPDDGAMSVAPGLMLGPSHSYGRWDFSFDVRGALRIGETSSDNFAFDETGQPEHTVSAPTTVFFAGGPRARWFALEGVVAPFFSGGIDALLFYTERRAGIGPSVHLGAGLEVMHDDAHGRLALELGLDLPIFRMRRGPEAQLDTLGPSNRHLYIVPASLAANWTF